MPNPFVRVPHGDRRPTAADAPNAALLIDFDNVTMGMRSDLANELRTLLGSDIIKGKVTVQRAYADWRRYPQYIVPLSEASIDLIFAPAYGSSKKNATDIRMAIDGIELVFIRPEIGTFILLTGDSDFSSLVLKLKEYGKYVIGIGIQESSSDILVQNCDEYYSYTALAGLSKTSDGKPATADPWQSVSEAVQRMAARGDVMRSDRLKQVLIEIAPGFDERNLGFRKFSRFLVEASRKGLLAIERGQNGQYAVALPGDAGGKASGSARTGKTAQAQPRRGGGRRGGRDETNGDGASVAADTAPALGLLRRALEAAGEDGRSQVRDSTIKRRLLALDADFDEGALGFAKFSKFLHFAADRGEVELLPLDGGGFDVRLSRADADKRSPPSRQGAGASPSRVDAKSLGLPHTKDAMESYLANRYRGVGAKTAEALVSKFGADLFAVMQDDPAKVRALLPRTRADRVLHAWEVDYTRRVGQAKPKARAARPADPEASAQVVGGAGPPGADPPSSARRGRTGGDHGGRGRAVSSGDAASGRPPRESPRRSGSRAAAARDAERPRGERRRSGAAPGAPRPEHGGSAAPAGPAAASADGSHVAARGAEGGADGSRPEGGGRDSSAKKPTGLVGFLKQAARRTRGRGTGDDRERRGR